MTDQRFIEDAPSSPSPSRRALEKWIGPQKRSLLVEMAVVCMAMAVSEQVIRSADPRYAQHLFDQEYTGGSPIAVNPEGFRGPSVPKEKPDGEFRVLALGDSVTFGTGVAVDQTWPAALERDLGKKRPTRVINAAVPATSLRDLEYGFRTEFNAYQPDAVVLALTGNHVALAWIRRDSEPKVPANPQPSGSGGVTTELKRWVKSLALPSFLSLNTERFLYQIGVLEHHVDKNAPYGALLAHGYRQLDLDPRLAEEAWQLAERDLAALRDTVTKAGSQFYLTMAPARFMLSDSLSDNEKAVQRERITIVPVERTKAIAERLGIPFIDADQALRAAREAGKANGKVPSLYLQGDYTHLDAEGAAVVAKAVSERLSSDRVVSR
jgi:lysophospholipase L1-like esterase